MTIFRPCIDLHNGQVKQIVGGTLTEDEGALKTNFTSDQSADYYARLYRDDGLTGGHIIMLGPGNEAAALAALAAYPGGLQIGGGITPDNAEKFLQAGATQVIVTSCIFDGPRFDAKRLAALVDAVGADRLVLDLSCRRTSGGWTVARDRWQTLTNLEVTHQALDQLSSSCCEFLIHAADVEGKCEGIDEDLVRLLGAWGKLPVTYAGGTRSLADLNRVSDLSGGKVDLAIGSALDIFGGNLISYADCVRYNQSLNSDGQ